MSNRGRVRLIVADVDLHCDFVSAAESLLPWKLLALFDLDHVDCLCLRESRLLWKLFALPDLDHVDCLCLPGALGCLCTITAVCLWSLGCSGSCLPMYADHQLGSVSLLESRLLWKQLVVRADRQLGFVFLP